MPALTYAGLLATSLCVPLLAVAACGSSAATTPAATPHSAGAEAAAATAASDAPSATTSAPETAAAPATSTTSSEDAAPAPPPTAPTGSLSGPTATGLEPGACAGLYDPDQGVAAPSRNALASYHLVGGFGNDARFELLPDLRVTYVVVNNRDGGPRCFRGSVTPAAVATFRASLAQARACLLPRDSGRPVADRGPFTFAFRLPGLSCQARLTVGRRSEADINRLEAVYTAFDALGASICGERCQRGAAP